MSSGVRLKENFANELVVKIWDRILVKIIINFSIGKTKRTSAI